MFIFPFRVKNPWKHFPVATVTLIGLNVIIFILTTHNLLIRREIIDGYAMRWGVSPLYTVFTSMFLHLNPEHLIGNMLYLWVFGPAVEDRLRVPGFLGLYFLTGFAAHLAQATLGAAGGTVIPTVGASGCIMGLLGAYWYLFSWSRVCVFYFFWVFLLIKWGVFEVAAAWIIGIYFLLDLGSGIFGRMYGVTGGVANFAHVGGALAGVLLVWALRMPRDSQEISQVRAVQADVKKLESLTLEEMRPLLMGSLDDEEALVHFARKAMEDGSVKDVEFALRTNMRTVLVQCPQVANHYLTIMHGSTDAFSPGDIVLIGRWCESNKRGDQALLIYAMVEEKCPESRELEVALFRSATIFWMFRNDSRSALAKLETLFAKFPAGMTLFEAEDLRDDILQKTRQAA